MRRARLEGVTMDKDIDRLSSGLQKTYEGLTVKQVRAPNPGTEDDGLWLVNHPNGLTDVQIESSTGEAPFLVESDFAPPTVARTVEDGIRLVAQRLGILLMLMLV